MTKLRLPRTARQLTAWLRDTQVGQRILQNAAADYLETECRKCRREYVPRPKVLVVVRRLGPLPGVEVFAERGVNVRLEELVDSQDDPVLEVLVEELLESQLPRQWKGMSELRSRSMVFRGLTGERRLRAVVEASLIERIGEIKTSSDT